VINEKKMSKITLSIGIAVKGMKEISNLYIVPIQQMYEAKLREGNSVIISPEMKELPITAILQHS
jgi:c-di-AMP phosphodiesterase-like protein